MLFNNVSFVGKCSYLNTSFSVKQILSCSFKITSCKIIRPLFIILPQMSRYIKYFENGGKKMPFIIKDDSILVRYNEILNKIKKTLGVKFHSMPVYDKKYIKAKKIEFNGVIKTNFLVGEVPTEDLHYICIPCITIDSVMKIERKNYPR